MSDGRIDRSENSNGTPQQLTNALTPGSDVVFNYREDQNIWGRHGNDTILGFDPAAPTPTPPDLDELEGSGSQFNWDVLLGDFLDEETNPELFRNPELTGKPGQNTFVLGDHQTPYYLDNFSLGLQQQGIIADFDTELDTLQLHGSREDYTLIPFALFGPDQEGNITTTNGEALVWQGADPATGTNDFDILSFFPDVSPSPGLPEEGLPLPDIDLDADYVEFVGASPPEVAEPEIKSEGTIGIDTAFGVSTDASGNVYITGTTSGSLAGPNQGGYDVWVAKYNSEGEQVWAEQFGTHGSDVAWDINTFVAEDGQVNLYLAGATTGSLATELGGGPPNEGYQDVWSARLDGDGNLISIQQNPQPLPGPEIDNSLQIDVDEAGNLYQSGVTVENVDSELTPIQDYSWVGKFDQAGEIDWFSGGSAFTGTGTDPTLDSTNQVGFDETYGIAASADGSTYVTGFSQQNLGGDPIGVYDVWLSRFDAEGNQLWTTKFGTETYDFAWGVDTDSENNAYVVGWTGGDLGRANPGSEGELFSGDVFITKYNPEGEQVWVEQFGTDGDDGLFLGDVVVDQNDNIFVTGFTDSDLGGENQGGYDTWVAKYNSQGEQLWAEQFGSSELDYASAITTDNFGNLYVSGYSKGSLGESNAGATDAWIAKLDEATGQVENFNGGESDLEEPGTLSEPDQDFETETSSTPVVNSQNTTLTEDSIALVAETTAQNVLGDLDPGEVSTASIEDQISQSLIESQDSQSDSDLLVFEQLGQNLLGIGGGPELPSEPPPTEGDTPSFEPPTLENRDEIGGETADSTMGELEALNLGMETRGANLSPMYGLLQNDNSDMAILGMSGNEPEPVLI
jgi:hypothetical protein